MKVLCFCENCNRKFFVYKSESKGRFCSRNCYYEWCRGINHHNYKNGIKQRLDGYLRTSDDQYIHRKTMEDYLDRKLTLYEVIHHIDGDVTNNSIENLQILTNSEHRKLHVKKQNRNRKGQFV